MSEPETVTVKGVAFALTPVWIAEHGSPRALQVYVILCDYATGSGGAVWPGLSTLAERCDTSKRTVRRTLRELEELGAVTTTTRARPNGSQASNSYELVGLTVPEIGPASRRSEPDLGGSPAPDLGGSPVPGLGGAPVSGPRGTNPIRTKPIRTKPTLEPPNPHVTAPPVSTGAELMSTPEPVPPASPPGFESFWSVTGRKQGKGAARKAYTKALKIADPADIAWAWSVANRVWATWPPVEARFIPLPATWLNQERWADDPPAPHAEPMSKFEETVRLSDDPEGMAAAMAVCFPGLATTAAPAVSA